MPLFTVADKLFQLLQKGLTQLDPALFTPLEDHLGKTVCIHLAHFPALYFEIQKNGLLLCQNPPSHIDTTFEGTLTAFLEMVLSKKPHTKGLHIRGDMACAKALYDAWQYSDWDFENQLAKIVGDTLAHTICQGLRQSHAFMLKTYENRKQDTADYLQNEKGILVSPLESEDLYAKISRLRDDVERFAVKIHLLEQLIEKRVTK